VRNFEKGFIGWQDYGKSQCKYRKTS